MHLRVLILFFASFTAATWLLSSTTHHRLCIFGKPSREAPVKDWPARRRYLQHFSISLRPAWRDVHRHLDRLIDLYIFILHHKRCSLTLIMIFNRDGHLHHTCLSTSNHQVRVRTVRSSFMAQWNTTYLGTIRDYGYLFYVSTSGTKGRSRMTLCCVYELYTTTRYKLSRRSSYSYCTAHRRVSCFVFVPVVKGSMDVVRHRNIFFRFINSNNRSVKRNTWWYQILTRRCSNPRKREYQRRSFYNERAVLRWPIFDSKIVHTKSIPLQYCRFSHYILSVLAICRITVISQCRTGMVTRSVFYRRWRVA